MSGHTPGPWRVGRGGPNLCPTVGTERGLMVAMVSHGEGHPTEANARLIAATPDLLEACRPMLSKSARTELLEMAEAEEAVGDKRIASALRFLLENEDKRRAAVAKAVQL